MRPLDRGKAAGGSALWRTALTTVSKVPPCQSNPSWCGLNSDANGPAERNDDVLTCDLPDDATERAASVAEGKIMTWAYCTQGWYNCGWPL